MIKRNKLIVVAIISLLTITPSVWSYLYEDSVDIPLTENIAENTVKMENTDIVKELPKVCGLSTIQCSDREIVKHLSYKYEVNWKLIEAIVIHETGNRTSYAYKELNNVGGLMRWDRIAQKTKLMQFETVYDSYETMIQIIKKYYLDKGLTTIEQIGEKYAPINASNDSKGLNNHWVEGVKSIYDNL